MTRLKIVVSLLFLSFIILSGWFLSRDTFEGSPGVNKSYAASSEENSGLKGIFNKLSSVMSSLMFLLSDLSQESDNPMESTKDTQEGYNTGLTGSPETISDYENTPQENPETIAGTNQENGTRENPYTIEPNQFKKICGQNTYLLVWRKGKLKGRDMQNPVTGGGPLGRKSFWILPSCQQLADCHCCCNTCQIPLQLCSPGFCFLCSGGCVPSCGPCPLTCVMPCEKYTSGKAPGPKNSDCMCKPAGCPKGDGCKIQIADGGKSGVEYTQSGSAKDVNKFHKGAVQVKEGKPVVEFSNGNGPGKKSMILDDGSGDTQPHGWIGQLKPEPGKCCKCVQDAKSAFSQGMQSVHEAYKDKMKQKQWERAIEQGKLDEFTDIFSGEKDAPF